tara:strand:+ start:352 stop:711 length:360 start_codon:yes stop_codon:yes gene_type:complete
MSDKPRVDIKPGEMALIIKAINWEDGEDWDGEINTSMLMNPEGNVPAQIRGCMMDVLTIMSAFLDYAQDNPDIYDLVEQRRNELMGIDIVEKPATTKTSVTKSGNVYTIDKWTKTEGSC